MRKIVAVCLTGCLTLGASAALAATATGGGHAGLHCNWDLVNTGSVDAYDIEAVVQGDATSWPTFQTIFAPASKTLTGSGSTSIHWQNPSRVITPNTGCHVGFTPPAGSTSCHVLGMYWTDIDGKRIGGSIPNVSLDLDPRLATLTNLTAAPVTVSNVRVACQAAVLPLDSLNASNEYLAGAMVTIADSLTLDAGQTASIPFTPPCSNCHCVSNFNASGAGLDAVLSPWLEQHVD